MSMADPVSEIPEPVLRAERRRLPSLVWLLPLVAAVVGAVLLIQSWAERGPVITLQFATAEGLEAGKTEVRYKNVVIGRVRRIELSEDRQHILATVALNADAAGVAVEDSRFWVVRPRADLGGVSGLSTLVSGAYVGVDVGRSEVPAREFVGLDQPPRVTNDQQGKRILLRAPTLGSLSVGSPVYFRSILVGQIVGFDLDEDGDGVTLQAFVEAPYDRYLTAHSRFWNASGVDVSIDANGLRLNTQSLVTLLAGGVAFQTLPGDPGEPVAENHSFELFEDQVRALTPEDRVVFTVRMRFNQSMRGLSVGTPVDFRGVEIGRVRSTELEYDARQRQFVAAVTAELFPRRLGRAYTQWQLGNGEAGEETPEALFARMIEQGLRAQLRTGNLITGQLYVALDLMPGVSARGLDLSARPLEIPTVAGSFDQIQAQIASIVSKVDALPVDELVAQLRSTVANADALLKQLDGELAPEARRILEQAQQTLDGLNQGLVSPQAPLQQDLRLMMEQVDRAARSLRDLADSLQRNPQSLLRGRPKPEADE
jgi:paraquat-inducible protein B